MARAWVMSIALVIALLPTCGAEEPRRRGARRRIIGGRDATFPEWGFTVAWVENWERNTAFCGGTVLDERFILTAAHCFIDIDGTVERWQSTDAIAKIGTVDIVKKSTYYQERTIKPNGITVHEKFRHGVPRNAEIDVAVVELNEPICFSGGVRPVVLNQDPERYQKYIGNPALSATVAGWGVTNKYTRAQTDSLKLVDVPVNNDQTCNQVEHSHTVSEHYMCAGRRGSDSCEADSGGPLVVTEIIDGQTQYIQVGIVAGEAGLGGCAGADTYGLYTKVHKVWPWIQQKFGGKLARPVPQPCECNGFVYEAIGATCNEWDSGDGRAIWCFVNFASCPDATLDPRSGFFKSAQACGAVVISSVVDSTNTPTALPVSQITKSPFLVPAPSPTDTQPRSAMGPTTLPCSSMPTRAQSPASTLSVCLTIPMTLAILGAYYAV